MASFAESVVAHRRRARSPPPRNASRPSSRRERRIARSRPHSSSPTGRSKGTCRASSESSASDIGQSWHERSPPVNHRGSRRQRRGTRPFQPIPLLPSLESGGHNGHPRTRRRSDDPQALVRHRCRRCSARARRARVRRSWGADQSAATVHVSPDLVDRAAAARQAELSSMLDARERSFAARSDAGIVSPDPVRDDRFQLAPASTAAPGRNDRLGRRDSSGCRSESGSAAASYSQSASCWPRG